MPPKIPPTNIVNDHFYSRVFILVTIAILASLLYKIILPFLGAVAWALLLAFLLYPLQRGMTRCFKGRKNVSATLLIFATFAIFVGPFTIMSIAFFSQISDLVQWIQETLNKQPNEQYQVLTDLHFVESILQWMHENFGIHSTQIKSWLAQAVLQLPPYFATMSGKIFLGAIDTALAFVIMLFMLFFFLRDGEEHVAMVRDLIPMTIEHREKLILHMAAVIRSVVFGTGLTVLVQGALIGVAFLITGLSSPMVFGILAALLALLPFGGTAFVWVPAFFVLAGQSHWKMTLIMLVIGLVASTIDNVLSPLFISSRGEVGTLPVFIGVLGGAVAFGPIGILLGPVVLALIIALLRFSLELQRAGD